MSMPTPPDQKPEWARIAWRPIVDCLERWADEIGCEPSGHHACRMGYRPHKVHRCVRCDSFVIDD